MFLAPKLSKKFALRPVLMAGLALPVLFLAGCSWINTNPDLGGEAKYPTGAQRSDAPGGQNDIYTKPESVFGKGGLNLFGGKDKTEGQSAIGVNTYLWRASLDTVSFMPLASADPFGGVILTDWYTPAATPKERLKLNVFILDRQLRADGIKVRVFRQVKKGSTWQDADVSPDMARRLEDAILTRARQLRVADMNNN